MFDPAEFCTVSLALVKPLVGVSSVKEAHSWIAEVAEHPMRGTAVAPENVVRWGAMALQPSSPVRMLTVLKTGLLCWVTQRQFAMTGSGVTV
jgi:hypothetical protein